MRRFPLALLLLIVVLAPAQEPAAAPGARSAPPPTQEDFERGLKAAQAASAQGKFAAARQQIETLLRAHEKADYVYARLAEIGALVKAAAFGARFPDPLPKTLISGELLSWDPRTGAVKIRYTPNKMEDWEGKELMVHPLKFKGPYSIELKGKEYPGVKSHPLEVRVCMSQDATVLLICGVAAENFGMEQEWLPARLVAIEPTGENLLAKKEHPPCRTGKPYDIKVRVTDAEVVATHNSQALLSGRRLKDYGQVAFSGSMPDEVILEGKGENAWLQGLVDGEREKNRREFERTFMLAKELPEWVSQPPPARVDGKGTSAAAPDYPDDLTRGQKAFADRVAGLLRRREVPEAMDLLRGHEAGDLPEATRAFLLGRLLEATGREAEAMAAFAKVPAGFRPAALLRARMLTETGKADEAAAVYRKLLEKTPDDAEVVVAAAETMLRCGRAAEAKTLVDQTLAHKVRSAELDRINEVLVKAASGPPWPQRFECTSQNFVVTSDIDKKTCEDAAAILEDGYRTYSTWFERVPDAGTRRFRVYLFSGEAGYKAWIEGLIGIVPLHTAGLYTPLLKVLLIWNLPSRDEMMRTVRHEGFHQYLDRLIPEAPSWFNEGLAEYFENARVEAGGWNPDDRHSRHAASLAEGSLVPLATFLFEPAAVFYGTPDVHYAEAWAFVTFLRHTSTENKQLFTKLWTALHEPGGSYAALSKVFNGVEINRLDREFSDWRKSRH